MSKELKYENNVSLNSDQDIEITKKNHIETLVLKSIITKIKNSLQGFHSRFQLVEKRIHEIEVESIEIIHSGSERKMNLKKNEQSLRDM